MGFEAAFNYRGPAEIFREHAALSGFENGGTRDFDIRGLSTISDTEYDALDPVQWPLSEGDGERGEKRFFADGQFFTPDGRARFLAPEHPKLEENSSPDYPLCLNTGRIRDQWHSMTRTGLSARLSRHLPEPFVDVHPRDAEIYGLVDGGLAEVVTRHGSCVLRVAVSEAQNPGSLFAPIHWSGENASKARVGDLVSAHLDPFSGQPEAKATPASISPVQRPLRGFVHTRGNIRFPSTVWWTKVAAEGRTEFRFAADSGLLYWHDAAQNLLGEDGVLVERLDEQKRIARPLWSRTGRRIASLWDLLNLRLG